MWVRRHAVRRRRHARKKARLVDVEMAPGACDELLRRHDELMPWSRRARERAESGRMHKLLVACSLAGCLQVDSGRPVPLEDFSRAWSTVYCERTFACYSPAEIAEMWDPDFPDERSCTVHL